MVFQPGDTALTPQDWGAPPPDGPPPAPFDHWGDTNEDPGFKQRAFWFPAPGYQV
ncbi:hypothetical protein [Mycobacteroides saopaulense]|uniref:hypothetical protein n=1 Tax=Mycobacteroides saopaulense TaxID=1578165 RepID=UPI0012FF75FD|nr:hypothetical protein [Mycobacteroides saopaulense]